MALSLLVGIALGTFVASGTARAQEVSRGAQPTPDSVEELGGALQEAFEEDKRVVGLFPWLTRAMGKLPPFLRDTEITFRARTYYFDRWNQDETRAQAWALGGAFVYRSGWLKDTFAVGAALYTSQRLYGEKDRDGTGLLQPGQKSYTVAGQAFAEFRYRERHRLKLYRQAVDLPYVNEADTRMTPNTFEAYLVRGSFSELPYLGELNYVAGWIDRIRPRDQDEFIPMSEAAGVEDGRYGMATAVLRSRPREDFYVGVTNHFVNHTMNTFYAEASYVRKLTDDWSLRLEGQFTHQASVGDERAPESPFDTWHGTLRLAASYGGVIATLAGSVTAEDAAIRKPWGLSPAYLGLMLSDFDRPGEEAWLLGLSYDFKHLGIPGLSAFVNLAWGYDARDISGGDRFTDQWEFDGTLDYRFQEGLLKGLWIRVRGATREIIGGPGDADEIRIIVNYDLPIL
jgi:hypothetical protein